MLWYTQPARHWLEALPIGNSQMGVMVFGNPDVETLALNEETFGADSRMTTTMLLPVNTCRKYATWCLPVVRRKPHR